MLILDYPNWNQPTEAQVLIPEAAYRLTPELEISANVARSNLSRLLCEE